MGPKRNYKWNYFELTHNGNTKFWDAAQTVRGKSIVLNAYIQKEERLKSKWA